ALGLRPAAQLWRALAAQALHGAVLCPGSYAQRLGSAQSRHLHLGPPQRLGDGQRNLHVEVVALADKHRRGRHVRDQVQVAWRPATPAGLALASQADATALAYAGRDVHTQALALAATTAAEQVGQDVSHRGGIEVEVAEATKAAARAAGRERAGAAVVLLALLGIAEHIVGLRDLLEALLGLLVVGVAVG